MSVPRAGETGASLVIGSDQYYFGDAAANPIPSMMRGSLARRLLLAPALAGAAAAHAATTEPAPYGLDARPAPRPYLGMPQQAAEKLPTLLSQTGAFADTRNLVPSAGLIPYDLVVAFWSDGARKSRQIAVPSGAKIAFAPTGEWSFPNGTVFIKTFELPIDENHPALTRRLETRLLVRDASGGVYGAVYKWRADGTDAELLSSSLTERIPIKTASGAVREQTWYYPSRKDCLTCHTARAGGVLGVKTRQLNRNFTYASGVTDNQLRAWNHLGLFAPELPTEDPAQLPRLAAADDATRSTEERARSYLDANCAQCHRPGGTVAYFDARYDTPLARQGLIDGAVLLDQGIDKARVISSHDIWRSIAYMRINSLGDIRMPPLARETINERGVALLREWILSLPGLAVLDPPEISPAGGVFEQPLQVSLRASEPGAEIRYTLDGSPPGAGDLRYEGPITLSGPTVLRARAFKPGLTRSIAVEQLFIVGK